MGLFSRNKGVRGERAMVHRHHEHGIPCEKRSRAGYAGPDLQVADEFTAEVKTRKDGQGFVQLETWLGTADILFLRRDATTPLVVLPWHIYLRLLLGYLHTPSKEHPHEED